MTDFKRGEIWWSNWWRGKGTEQFYVEKQRPVVIVSDDDFNKHLDLVTVIPSTNYKEGKENSMSQWGITLQLKQDIDEYEPFDSDVKREKSLLDCGQLTTMHKNALVTQRGEPWRLGILQPEAKIRIDLVLQSSLLGVIGCEPYGLEKLPYNEGDIVVMNLPDRPKQRCVVVSSMAIDLLREGIRITNEWWKGKRGRPLGHCTVVPLEPGLSKEPDIIPVITRSSTQEPTPIDEYAMCRNVYNIDWRARYVYEEPVGKVLNIRDVQIGLRNYLDLPFSGTELSTDHRNGLDKSEPVSPELIQALSQKINARSLDLHHAFWDAQLKQIQLWEEAMDEEEDIVTEVVPVFPDTLSNTLTAVKDFIASVIKPLTDVLAVSDLWPPEGFPIPTAGATPEQQLTFPLGTGHVELSLEWGAATQTTKGYITIKWRVDISIPGMLWLWFINPEEMTVLSELPLSDRLLGEVTYTEDQVGFNLSRVKWGVMMVLREKEG